MTGRRGISFKRPQALTVFSCLTDSALNVCFDRASSVERSRRLFTARMMHDLSPVAFRTASSSAAYRRM